MASKRHTKAQARQVIKESSKKSTATETPKTSDIPGPRRSSRRRTPRKKWDQDEELKEEAYKEILEAQGDPKEDPQDEDQTTGKRLRKRKSEIDNHYSDIEIDAYEDDADDEDYDVSKEKPSLARKPGRKRIPLKQTVVNVRKPFPKEQEEEVEQILLEDVRKYISHIKTPRSTENDKYKDVYDTIPKLRSASPPRFTTKGIKKKRLRPEELGVKVIGKTKGNPFSNYGKKRNGIIYGNQPLKTIEDMEKYAGAAINIKKVLKKQAENLRLSSYVKPHVLEEARNRHVPKRRVKKESKEEDVDVDIETVDDNIVSLKPELATSDPKKGRGNRGRKPGRTILECEDCGYKTTHSGHMKIHIICVHKDVKLLECQYEGCGYRCARKGSMTRHEKCVHRKDQVFKCELCPFESAWSISLERHIVTKHEKLKPWTCQVCHRSFGQQFTLTTHMNTVHKKVKRVRCAFCSFRSSTKVSVRAHILRMHKAEIEQAMNEAEEKDTGCDVNGTIAEETDNSDTGDKECGVAKANEEMCEEK